MNVAVHPVGAAEFREVAQFVHFKSGIQLDANKSYLVETRLGPLLDEFGASSYLELCRRASTDSRVLNRIIDEISTNETSWFRDSSPFELFKYKLIPEIMDRLNGRIDRLNIWSAASSTGQEVYSVAMCLAELLPMADLQRVRLVGTDISDRAVRAASMASYSNYEVERGLPATLRDKYMQSDGTRWKVREDLRALATFKQLNLLESFGVLGSFDIIFCRNVAIYFDLPTRKSLFERLARQLKPGGMLVIGSSETLHGVTDVYERKEYLRSAFYTVR
ncbi:MAG: protein-glutamate O-methyltransferase CheR [Pseudomonadota bacterium]